MEVGEHSATRDTVQWGLGWTILMLVNILKFHTGWLQKVFRGPILQISA